MSTLLVTIPIALPSTITPAINGDLLFKLDLLFYLFFHPFIYLLLFLLFFSTPFFFLSYTLVSLHCLYYNVSCYSLIRMVTTWLPIQ